jgi:hypothetical protein
LIVHTDLRHAFSLLALTFPTGGAKEKEKEERQWEYVKVLYRCTFKKMAFVQRPWCVGNNVVFPACFILPEQAAELNKGEFLVVPQLFP